MENHRSRRTGQKMATVSNPSSSRPGGIGAPATRPMSRAWTLGALVMMAAVLLIPALPAVHAGAVGRSPMASVAMTGSDLTKGDGTAVRATSAGSDWMLADGDLGNRVDQCSCRWVCGRHTRDLGRSPVRPARGCGSGL